MGDALAEVHQHEAVQVERLPDEVDKKEQLKKKKVSTVQCDDNRMTLILTTSFTFEIKNRKFSISKSWAISNPGKVMSS